MAYLFATRNTVNYHAKYSDLKSRYISLATGQKYSLETLFKTPDLKSLMPEYNDKSKEEFEEAVRRKIIKLDMEISSLKNGEDSN